MINLSCSSDIASIRACACSRGDITGAGLGSGLGAGLGVGGGLCIPAPHQPHFVAAVALYVLHALQITLPAILCLYLSAMNLNATITPLIFCFSICMTSI